MDFVSNILIQGSFKSRKTHVVSGPFYQVFPLEDGRLTTPSSFTNGSPGWLRAMQLCRVPWCFPTNDGLHSPWDSHVFGCPKNTRNAEIFSGEVESKKTHLFSSTQPLRGLSPINFFWQVGCDKNANAHLSTGKNDLKMKRP